jgi:hypothetical protein
MPHTRMRALMSTYAQSQISCKTVLGSASDRIRGAARHRAHRTTRHGTCLYNCRARRSAALPSDSRFGIANHRRARAPAASSHSRAGVTRSQPADKAGRTALDCWSRRPASRERLSLTVAPAARRHHTRSEGRTQARAGNAPCRGRGAVAAHSPVLLGACGTRGTAQ